MTPIEWTVILGGLAAIAWVNWYFFLAGRSSTEAAVDASGVQEVTINVAVDGRLARLINVVGIPIAAGVLYPAVRAAAQPHPGQRCDGLQLGQRGRQLAAAARRAGGVGGYHLR